MAAGFVHLDVRSYFSLKEGAFSPEQLAHRAASLGMPAVAMTDRDGLYGAARFVRACADAGVRPILGASLTVRADGVPAGERDAHVVLLAEDDRGYANLCRLVTDAQLLGERGDPAITVPQICAHAAGMTVVLGPRFASRPARGARTGGRRRGARRPVPRRLRPARCVVAAEHRLEPGSDAEIRAMLRLAERLQVPALATNPVRYLVP